VLLIWMIEDILVLSMLTLFMGEPTEKPIYVLRCIFEWNIMHVMWFCW